MPKKDTETYYPKSRAEWRKWLEQNHQSEQSIWLIYYRSSTKVASLSWSDAVEEALCFGWIDSTKKTIDKESYMQYFSRRKPNSTWSKINKDKVDKLIQNNLMTKAGFDIIEIAKQNGSWTILDDVEALVMPADLKDALENYKGSMEFYESLSKSGKKGLLYWVISAKRAETRQKRILEIAENASKKKKPKHFWLKPRNFQVPEDVKANIKNIHAFFKNASRVWAKSPTGFMIEVEGLKIYVLGICIKKCFKY